MSKRVDYRNVAPEIFDALLHVQKRVKESGLEPDLLELVKIRASQLNGCAYCLDMHCREARANGEAQRRIDLIVAWRESGLFTPREQVALAWTEVLTRLSEDGVSDELYASAHAEFGDVGLAGLTLAVVAINSWNRFGVAFALPLP